MNLAAVLLVREFVVRPRRASFHAGRVLFVVGGSVVVLISFTMSGMLSGSAIGLSILGSLSVAMQAVSCLLAMFSASAALSREREEKTLSLLFLTDVTGGDLLFSRTGITFAGTSLMALSALPLFTMLICLGGITIIQVLVAYVLFLCTIFLGSGIGLWAAAVTRSEWRARMAVVGMGAFVFVLAPWLLCAAGRQAGLPVDVLAEIFSPFAAMHCVTDYAKLARALPNCVLDLVAGSGFLLLAWMHILRSRASGDWVSDTAAVHEEPDLKERKFSEANRIIGNPIIMRDMHCSYRKTYRHSWWGVLALLACCAAVVRAPFGFFFCFQALSAVIFLYMAIVLCSRAFVMEKKNRILDLLIAADVSVESVVLGKLAAVFRALSPWFIAAVVVLAVQILFDPSALNGTFFIAVFDYMCMCVVWSFFALALGLKYERNIALGMTLITFVLWNLVWRSMTGLFFSPLGVSVDFAFHVWLLLVACVMVEGASLAMRVDGSTTRTSDEIQTE